MLESLKLNLGNRIVLLGPFLYELTNISWAYELTLSQLPSTHKSFSSKIISTTLLERGVGVTGQGRVDRA